jgi:hypothetical protein
MDTPQKKMLTVKAAVQATGFSKTTIYRWLDTRKVIGKKLGRSTYVDAASLEAAINALPDYRPEIGEPSSL